MNVAQNVVRCPRCHWRFRPQDMFCGGCGNPLARLTVFPDPEKDLGGDPLAIFPSFPIILRVRNDGVVPIQIKSLTSEDVELGLWVETNLPFTLPQGEEKEIKRHHKAQAGDAGWLHLTSSCQSYDFPFRCDSSPHVWLATETREFSAHTDQPQSCPMDQNQGRIAFTLRLESGLVLQGSPYVSRGRDVVGLLGLPSSDRFPVQLPNGNALTFLLVRKQDFPEDGYPVQLVFPFQNPGEVVFNLLLRYIKAPIIDIEFNPQALIGPEAVTSGSSGLKPVEAEIRHGEGNAFRISLVESDQPWLVIQNAAELQNMILNPSESNVPREGGTFCVTKLTLDRGQLPRVQQLETVTATLSVKGSTVGDDESFVFKQTFPVELRPPKTLDFPIAVDFGTTNSCVAYFDGNTPRLFETGIDETPNELATVFQFMAIESSGNILEPPATAKSDERFLPIGRARAHRAFLRFGYRARELRFKPGEIFSIAWGFKRFLTQPQVPFVYRDRGSGDIRMNGAIYRNGNQSIQINVIEKVGLYLRFLLERFQEHTGYIPREAIFTYPAVFNRQKAAFRQAIDIAVQDMDLEVQLDISEPEAIAVYHAEKMLREGNDQDEFLIAVFDCGGGTTDISIVRVQALQDEKYEVDILASDGDPTLGGDLLSFRIAQHFYQEIIPPVYRARFPFLDTLEQALRAQDQAFKENFSALFSLAEGVKENRPLSALPDFNTAFEEGFYRANLQRGILDLIADPDIQVNWPSVKLIGRNREEFQVSGLTRRFEGQEISEGTEPLNPLRIERIREVIQSELKRGFDKLVAMQKELFERRLTSGMLLDCLVLDGNSSRLPVVWAMANSDQLELQVKEVILHEESLKKSVSLGAAFYGRICSNLGDPLMVRGVHKLNYPIGMQGLLRFRPLFERWTPLDPGRTIQPDHDPPISETSHAKQTVSLYEFFGWDYNVGAASAPIQRVAELAVPVNEEAFRSARYWSLQVELRCDSGGRAHLFYNYGVGMNEDGSDFRSLWDEHRECVDFVYT